MADAPQTSGSEPENAPAAERGHDAPGTAWWARIAIFVAGVVVGVVGLGLLDTTTPDFGARQGAGPQGSGGASPSGGGAGVEARVNAACLAVINDAQDVYAVLNDLGPALDDTDLLALDEIVRRLQPVEPRLAADLRACRIDTGAGATTGPSATPASPTPVPTPTGSGATPGGTPGAGPTTVQPTIVAPSSVGPTVPPSSPATPPGRAPGTIVLR